jgi:hypothetical protein
MTTYCTACTTEQQTLLQIDDGGIMKRPQDIIQTHTYEYRKTNTNLVSMERAAPAALDETETLYK